MELSLVALGWLPFGFYASLNQYHVEGMGQIDCLGDSGDCWKNRQVSEAGEVPPNLHDALIQILLFQALQASILSFEVWPTFSPLKCKWPWEVDGYVHGWRGEVHRGISLPKALSMVQQGPDSVSNESSIFFPGIMPSFYESLSPTPPSHSPNTSTGFFIK